MGRLTYVFGVLAITLITSSAATITGLGFVTNTGASYVSDISADGSTVVGHTLGTAAFRWTKVSGMQDLGKLVVEIPGGHRSEQIYALAVSADGSVILGESHFLPFRWTEETGMQLASNLIPPWSGYTLISGISADGQTIISHSFHFPAFQAYKYTAADGLTRLEGLSYVDAISADGRVIAGYNLHKNAVRYETGESLADLGHLEPCSDYATSIPWGMTADGKVIVGQSSCDWTATETDAFRWSAAKGLERLEKFAGEIRSCAYATALDGRIVGGFSVDSNNVQHAVIWNESGRGRLLWSFLAEKGVDLSGWQGFMEVRGISTNGLAVAGTGINSSGAREGFLVELESADFAPTLTMSKLESGAVSVVWSRAYESWCLEQRGAEIADGAWEPVTNILVSGENCSAVVPPERGLTLFRLRQVP